MMSFPQRAGSPLHKIDSVSSEDAYNMYESYYKRMPQSQGGEREKLLNFQQTEIAKKEEPVKKPEGKIHSEVRSSHYEDMMQNEQFTKAYLYELVQRINPLPIVENRVYGGRAGKQSRLTKKSNFR
mmetsp:Transcript_29238/g.33494  ORF Transcript_29238/g.33494 Transcript_29238/m.33494 type:complete len:126 (-) Transcript_29238:926-1303(-)